MKMAAGMEEDGIIVGNLYDKYSSKNPVVRRMLRGYADALSGFVAEIMPRTIHDIGCGEGYWVFHWIQEKRVARGSDFSKRVIAMARENARSAGISSSVFSVRSVYDLEPVKDSADLIVCCEVLEHLENPAAGLLALQRTAVEYVILSVPREPIWSFLNLMRGKYLHRLGNTPGHLQRWSADKFIEFVSGYFDIVGVKTPLPWTMLLCRVKR